MYYSVMSAYNDKCLEKIWFMAAHLFKTGADHYIPEVATYLGLFWSLQPRALTSQPDPCVSFHINNQFHPFVLSILFSLSPSFCPHSSFLAKKKGRLRLGHGATAWLIRTRVC